MPQLTKEQKEKLDKIVLEKKFFKMVNNFFKEHGAPDLQLQSFRVQPKNNFKISDSPIDALRAPNFDVFPPKCEHGYPMVEVCTRGGSCRWVCNHP